MKRLSTETDKLQLLHTQTFMNSIILGIIITIINSNLLL